jgi:hypothetical protein
MKTPEQLQVDIENVANVPISGRSNIDIIGDLRSALDQIIKLYADEFFKANTEIELRRVQAKADADMLEELRRVIVDQKQANDELFRLKQKVVIVNRELLQKNAQLEKALAETAHKRPPLPDDPNAPRHVLD